MSDGWNIKVSRIKAEEIPGRYVVTHVTPRGIIAKFKYILNNIETKLFRAGIKCKVETCAPSIAIKIKGREYAKLMNIDPEVVASYCAVEGAMHLVPMINMGGELHHAG